MPLWGHHEHRYNKRVTSSRTRPDSSEFAHLKLLAPNQQNADRVAK